MDPQTTRTILDSLKDYAQCNDDLTATVRATILEPFQPDLSDPSSAATRKRPTRTEFKNMIIQLAPLAMRVVNQNMESLRDIRQRGRGRLEEYSTPIQCLIDTSCYALLALKHMNAYTSLKPLDIEKTMSNLIGKVVDLEQYMRALEELNKLRNNLARIANIPLENMNDLSIKRKDESFNETPPGSPSSARGFLTESPNRGPNHDSTSPFMSPNARISMSDNMYLLDKTGMTRWEDDMIKKYGSLFFFPLDKSINDPSTILLVLAYQVNAIRCWIDINEGVLLKYLPQLLDRAGNFLDWCSHLYSFEEELARKQFEVFYRQLSKAASKLPVSEGSALYSYALQALALKALRRSSSVPERSLCDRMVQIGVSYEKSETQINYRCIQRYTGELVESVNPNINDLAELDAYFVLCEYYAYVSRKASSHKGSFYAYNSMARPLQNLLQHPESCTYYHAAYAANAKLALCSCQLDRIVAGDSYSDLSTALQEVSSCLQIAYATSKQSKNQDDYAYQAMQSLYKSIDTFRQSTGRYFEFIEKKAKRSNESSFKKSGSHVGSPSNQSSVSRSLSEWRRNLPSIATALQRCSELLPLMLQTMKKKSWTGRNKQVISPTDVMLAIVDITVLLARIQFRVDDEDTYHAAYECLSTGEQLCSDYGYAGGYRWLSGAYYTLGAAMVNAKMYSTAIYPLRKACALLEKDSSRIATDAGKLQLCRRYEILGACCERDNRFEEATKMFRLALKRLPFSSIEAFVKDADSLGIFSLIENNPFIPKLIERFMRSVIVDDNQTHVTFASELMDIDRLTASQRCIIHECELKVLYNLSAKLNCSRHQRTLINTILHNYSSKTHPLRRVRVLLDKIRVEVANIKDKASAIQAVAAITAEATKLLKMEDYGSDSDLLRYRRHYLALVSSWTGICKKEQGQESTKAFLMAFHHWGMLLKNVMPIYFGTPDKGELKQIRAQVDELDRLYDHLRMLADYFGVNHQFLYQINVLRLMLKLNNGLRGAYVDSISSSIMISSSIGRIYSQMGYSGKAAFEFALVKEAIQSKSCSLEAELAYMIFYSLHLARLGNYAKSQDVFNAAKSVWESILEPPVIRGPLKTIRRRISQRLILADAYYIRSVIMSQESLQAALDDCTTALHILHDCCSSIKADMQARSAKSGSQIEDPFNSRPVNASENSTDENAMASSIAFKESEWTITQKLSICLLHISHLHMTKGSWRHAQYYVQKGLELGDKLGSDIMRFRFLVSSSILNLRCGDPESSKVNLKTATTFQPEGNMYMGEDVILKMATGNIDAYQNYLKDAIQAFDEADHTLKKMMDVKYIATLEHLIERGETKETNEPTQVDLLHSTDNARERAQQECRPLQNMQGINAIYKALAMVQNGSIVDALALLERIEEANIMTLDEPELFARIAQLRIELVWSELSSRNDAKISQKEALVLPSLNMQLPRASMGRRGNRAQDLRLIRDNLTHSLERILGAHRVSASKANVHLVQELCNRSAYTMFLKNYFSSGDRVMFTSYAGLCAYYLEMAKGITLRREMQGCLATKLDPRMGRRSINDIHWPKRITENQEEEDEDSMDLDIPQLPQLSSLNDWIPEYLKQLRQLYDEEHDLDDEEFQEKFVDILPSHWTVCALTMDVEKDILYATRLHASETPVTVKLPLDRSQRCRPEDPILPYSEAISRLQDIISSSDETIRNSRVYAENNNAEQWWSKRRALDQQLKELLEAIERTWFGGFKGILCGDYHEHQEVLKRFQQTVNQLLCKAVYGCSVDQQQPSRKCLDIDIGICRIFLHLGPDASSSQIEDILYFLLGSFERMDVPVDYSAIDVAEITSQLRLAMRTYHQNAQSLGIRTAERVPNSHVILIPDKNMQSLPLESMNVLRNQSVSRVPCISFLRDRILYAKAKAAAVGNQEGWVELSIDGKNTYYVLNPSGDLKQTQDEFQSAFERMTEWRGLVQEKPVEYQLAKTLESLDLYLYFGHSAGESLIRGQNIRKLQSCPVALLMGCSSAALSSKGEYDPDGYINNYLLAGSPAVVGNLWDVTDKSIDQFTRQLLHTWGLLPSLDKPEQPVSLVEAVAASRNHCSLPYLIGAAPVVYGIPVYLKE